MDIAYKMCVLVEYIYTHQNNCLLYPRKDVLMLIPRIYEYVTLHHKRLFSFITKLKILRHYLRLYRWIQCRHWDSRKREARMSYTQREADGSNLKERDATSLAVEMEEEAVRQGTQLASISKREKLCNGFSARVSRRMQAYQYLRVMTSKTVK